MPKFRKKPIVIDAFEFKGLDGDVMSPRTVDFFGDNYQEIAYVSEDGVLKIRTLEGDMTAQIGDFIIKGVNGEFYPCKSDIFEKTYEPVTD